MHGTRFFAVWLFVSSLLPAASPAVRVEKWSTYTVTLHAGRLPRGNPFVDVDVTATVTRPDGTTLTVDGFYDGDGRGGSRGTVWKLRFCPDQPGVWRWITHSNLAELDQVDGRFICLPSSRPGPLVADGHFFRRAGGAPLFLIGNFLDDSAPRRERYSHTLFSETLSDAEREAMVKRAVEETHANKINIYLANRGDYGGIPTTPWSGTADHNDKSRFALRRWRLYEQIIRELGQRGLFAELWFFADDSNFGKLSEADRRRLIRYGMARLSAFPNTLFVLCLEWQEGWSPDQVVGDIRYGQAHNPWKRLWSVHGVNGNFAFPNEPSIDFMATQPGNDIRPTGCNAHTRYNTEIGEKPLLVEELGHSSPDNRARVRANAWAAFCGGAAGLGTGADLARLRAFIEHRRVPFWKMVADNSFTDRGFALATYRHEMVVYVPAGSGAVHVLLSPGTWSGVWFNPREGGVPEQAAIAPVSGGDRRTFTPPDRNDWVLHLRNSTPDRRASSDASPLVRHGHFVQQGRIVLGWVQHNGWWRPGQRPNLARRSIGDPEGDVRPCRTEDLDALTRSMLRWGYPGFEHNFGLWYDRRRDAHDTRVRRTPFVRPPFLEQPWARSGRGRACDGLSRYDLTRFNRWYFQRIKTFADLCDLRGTILFYKFYMQHALLEQPAHYIDFPWAPANTIQKTGMPPAIPAANAFYDTRDPERARLHRLYIRHCLDVLADNRNVVFFPAEEYTGGIGFVRFLIDTVRDWEKETGRTVTLALGAPRDVLDAVLADPVREPAVDVLDLRYFWLRKDGSSYAPPGGRQMPGRDFESGFRAVRETSPEMEYRKVLAYRRRFPDKAIVDALEADRALSWAFFMAGGDLLVRGQIHYPHYADPPRYVRPADVDIILPTYDFIRKHLAREWPNLSPATLARADSGPAWCLADPGVTYLIYVLHGGRVTVDLRSAPGWYLLRRFDPADGALSAPEQVRGGSRLTASFPAGRDGVLWIQRGGPKVR